MTLSTYWKLSLVFSCASIYFFKHLSFGESNVVQNDFFSIFSLGYFIFFLYILPYGLTAILGIVKVKYQTLHLIIVLIQPI